MSQWVECAYCSEPTDAGRICDTCRGSKLPSVAPRRITQYTVSGVTGAPSQEVEDPEAGFHSQL